MLELRVDRIIQHDRNCPLADFSQLSPQRKLLAGAIALLALTALGVSSYLTWVTWQQSTVAGCTGGSLVDCDEVLTSAWSKWLGIPVSVFGALTYAVILAVVFPAVLVGGWAMTTLLTLAMMAAGAGAWFIGMQAFILEHFCLYCMAVHCCGILICIATIFLLRSAAESNVDHMSGYFAAQPTVVHESSAMNVYQPLIAAGIASVGLAVLIGGQMLFAPSGMEIVESTPLVVVDQPPTAEDESTPAEPEATAPATAEVVEPAAEPAEVKNDDVKNDVADDNVAEDDTAGIDDQELFPENDDQELFPEDEETQTQPVAQANEEVKPSEEITRSSVKPPIDGAPRVFRLSSLAKEIDAADNPVIGNPYAPRRFVEMLDYTCPHCRKLNPFIRSAVERYGNQIGFVIYHIPLSRKCNKLVQSDQAMHANACEYARLAYGVWKIAPDKFPEFHDWLMEGKKAPPIYDAKQKAMKLAGSEVLVDKQIALESNQRVVDHASQMEPLRVGLPILVFDGGIVRGMPDTEAQWFEMLEQRMGMQPPANVAN